MIPNLELAIGELRLTGFDPHGRAELMERVQALLAERLAGDAGAWAGATDIAIDRLDLGRIAPGPSRQATAERIAGGIHAAIAQHRETTKPAT